MSQLTGFITRVRGKTKAELIKLQTKKEKIQAVSTYLSVLVLNWCLSV